MVSKVSFASFNPSVTSKHPKKEITFKNSSVNYSYSQMMRPSYQQQNVNHFQTQPQTTFWQKASSVLGNSKPFEEIIFIGVVALGIAKRKSIAKALGGKSSQIKSESSEAVASIKNKLDDLIQKFDSSKSSIDEAVNKAHEAKGPSEAAKNIAEDARIIAYQAMHKDVKSDLIIQTPVKINGNVLNLGNVINRVAGEDLQKLETELKTNASKHLLGREINMGEILAQRAELIGSAEQRGKEITRRLKEAEVKLQQTDKNAKLSKEQVENIQKEVTEQFNKKVQEAPITVRTITSELNGYTKDGGLAMIPGELTANLSTILNKGGAIDKVKFVMDTPMYLGKTRENHFYRLIENPDGTFNYIRKEINPGGKNKIVSFKVEKIDEFETNILTDKMSQNEKVRLFKLTDQQAKLDYKQADEHFTPELRAQIDKALIETGKFENNNIVVKLNDKNQREIYAKIDTVFWDNRKFNLNSRPAYGDEKISIYNNSAISSGETERYTYFNKFFYEHMIKMKETTKNGVLENSKGEHVLGADAVIGNDWHTGPLAAMLRQLSPVRKTYGQIDAATAKNLQDMPMIGIMHNAKYAGEVNHSQAKLLNVMYGEHASLIAENSHAINTHVNNSGGLPFNLFNTHMNGDGFSPQAMFVNYTDKVVPVSGPDFYTKELALTSLGGPMKPLFALRARLGEFADNGLLQTIARNNGVNPEKLAKTTSMRGITNGSDKAANLFTAARARKLEKDLGLAPNSLKSKISESSSEKEHLDWVMHNKKVLLNEVLIPQVESARAGKGNPMKLFAPDKTDLSGVTENTPIIGTAGRIVDQKGIDIFGAGIKEYITKLHKQGDEFPVFYLQGNGDKSIMNAFGKMKDELSVSHPEAAKRIVFANLFSEPGRYDAVKVFSDVLAMTSKFEPCGLVHKEAAAYGGSLPLVHKVGGLPHGIDDGVNSIIVKNFGIEASVAENAKHLAEGIKESIALFNDKDRYAKGVTSILRKDWSWLAKGGAAKEYIDNFAPLKYAYEQINK